MYEVKCDVAIIGGGPAGLSAAVAAKKEGAKDVLVIERDNSIGGILQQCIHPGFGLSYFKKELTGPEYAGRFAEEALNLGVDVLLNTMVLDFAPERKEIICASSENGMTKVTAKSIVLAMGCRERTRPNIQIPGTRPAGVYTAGSAQRLVNRQNTMVGKNVVILGSGDIGMIMARRMSLEGAKVLAVVEIMDYLAGLTRNKVQCLDDFGIPLKLGHTITRIVGNERVEGVYVAQVDENKKPIKETEEFIECDTLLLSVGLLPENELTRKAEISISRITNGPEVDQYMQTSSPGVFASGNVVHVNDLVDNVTVESMQAGKYAALYAMDKMPGEVREVTSLTGNNVRYLCPQRLRIGNEEKAKLFFRVLQPDANVRLVAKCGDEVIASVKEKRVNPGEICCIQIPMDKVGDDVLVEVVKEA
ncbi:NADPH-dependent 2,4-dienoyl-CoA reductase/sulfur reductase-like enzyme [Aequitasia blattaphilus]|uniref:NAD(P)/FAD-dependent oxidoreductase n=1 Tax=Aequitasia blattaphilus TaxID=2949332 RepID=A0ABT1ECN8_9FIRM|nr:NAD(P)/FAD-dependent oxidoreductase [Aequitasia blattaphilus]MCP1103419.1 NAD(P)/FAD-dependent oxidoreductase [Aequitasia blattaphilus]MCR8616059.1 NAD(P)/FAD-dependent oxidoreductase [Aequitasia blattaphilus]